MLKIGDDAMRIDLQGEAIAEITETWYWDICNAVPPLAYNRDSFVCGEPWSHDDEGQALYSHYARYNGKFYALAACRPMAHDDIIKRVAELVSQKSE